MNTHNLNDDPENIIPDEVPPAVEYDEIVTTADATGPGGSDPSKPHGKLP